MTGTGTPAAPRPRRFVGWAIAGVVLAVFFAANAHLVVVSFASRPDCVLRTKPLTEGVSAYRAAKPSC